MSEARRAIARRVGVKTGYLQDARKLLEAGTPWAGLAGDALAFVLADVAADGRWLVVVDEADRAERLARALTLLHPEPRSVALLPADDNKPYDGFSPDPEGVRQRLRTLQKVDAGGPVVVIATARSLLQRVPAAPIRHQGTRVLKAGQVLDRDALVEELTRSGYLVTSRADVPGAVAVRGDVVDLWPAHRSAPVRLDFFDDEIEEIRKLTPGSLRAGPRLKQVGILPAREDRLDAPALERLHRELGRLVSEQKRGMTLRRRVYEELKAGVRFSAVEDWLPALVPTVAPLQALGDLRTVVVHPEDVAAAMRDFQQMARQRWGELEEDERPLVPPEERYADAEEVLEALKGAHPVFGIAAGDQAVDLGAQPVEGFNVRGSELAPVVARIQALAEEQDARVGLVVDTGTRADRLLELLQPHGLYPKTVQRVGELERGKVGLLVGDLPQGFLAPESGWALIPVGALFGGSPRIARKAERAAAMFDAAVTSMAQLKAGDPVVHRVHGVGLYRGLQRLPVTTRLEGAAPDQVLEQDFVKLEYRGGDLMFLPVTALEQLSRYTPGESHAKVRLDKLGGATWAARKGKVRDNLLKMAQELLDLYARRETAERPVLDPPGPTYRAFEARFPHQETPDQAAAIEAVQEDLSRPFPMDRLICGDVGFGKTEVAMRAAMRVVESGYQVAVLCPTTVLAYQHLHTFRERFAGFPIRIEMLSRFNSPAQEREVVDGLGAGKIDIVIGTTSVLGRRVRYRNLGMVIIDEEHRFGVKQKERLKKLRSEVDVLAMSATPIPRTLQMALSGARDMSIMATPPADRLAVRTTVARPTESRVRDAIRQELERGGQAFVIHNRVETIDAFTDQLRAWVPDARFVVAHGQMDDETLERVLVDFVERRADVLVSTSIVESGIDMPRVNTMLVHRADLFGLAQLYQLRGRVGRANVRASCILLVPEQVSRDARKRLRVLVDNTQLGAGFQVAAADLELRGGGNLLGAQQSGNIDKVGYETWLELLEQAVHSARGERDRDRIDPEIEVPVAAFIPDALIPDAPERLGWYRRLASAGSPQAVDRILEELEGWIGDLPLEVRNLGDLMATRASCRELGIVRCTWLKVRAVLELHPASDLPVASLRRLVKRHPKRFKVTEATEGRGPVLEARFTPGEAERPFRYLRWIFAQLRRGEQPGDRVG